MTAPAKHPSPELLLEFASGDLDVPARVLVAGNPARVIRTI